MAFLDLILNGRRPPFTDDNINKSLLAKQQDTSASTTPLKATELRQRYPIPKRTIYTEIGKNR